MVLDLKRGLKFEESCAIEKKINFTRRSIGVLATPNDAVENAHSHIQTLRSRLWTAVD